MTEQENTSGHGGYVPQVLVVDDEPAIRSALVRALGLRGYRVDQAASGEEAVERLRDPSYDLVLLDLSMPGMDGVEVMQQARRNGCEAEIIVLTGHAALESAIAALKAGAADYLLKPVSLHSLGDAVSAALAAHGDKLRRQRALTSIAAALTGLNVSIPGELPVPGVPQVPPDQPQSRHLSVGPLILDQHKRSVSFVDKPERNAELTEGECSVLAILMQHANEVMSCRQIVRHVWHNAMDEIEAQSVVRPYIFRLRRKLEPNPDESLILQTVRGRGYLYNSR